MHVLNHLRRILASWSIFRVRKRATTLVNNPEKEHLRELDIFSLEGILISVKGCQAEGKANLYSAVPEDRTQIIGFKL